MTTTQFVASWVLFIIAGFVVLGPVLSDEGYGKTKGGVLLVVVSFLTSGLLAGLTLLGSA